MSPTHPFEVDARNYDEIVRKSSTQAAFRPQKRVRRPLEAARVMQESLTEQLQNQQIAQLRADLAKAQKECASLRLQLDNSQLVSLVSFTEGQGSDWLFHSLFEQVVTGVAIANFKGEWLRLNQRFCDLTGYSEKELIALGFQGITHPDTLEADIAARELLISGELPYYQTEKRYICKDGSLLWVHLTAFVARDPFDNPKCAIALIQDISRRKEAERMLREQQTILQQSLDSLYVQPDLDSFLGYVLKAIAEQLDATAVDIWLEDDSEPPQIYLHLTYLQGQILTAADQPDHPGFIPRPSSDFQGHPSWQVLRDQRQPFIYDDLLKYPEVAALRARSGAHQNVRSALLLPLVFGEKYLGTCAIYDNQVGHYSPPELQMASTLAQRIVLALQLTKLAKESEQVAIVREREKAAQERVRELAQANKILKKSLNFLSSELNLNVFVGQILTVMAEQFDVPLAEYWRVKGKCAYICTIWWQGQLHHRESIAQVLPSHPGLKGLQVSPETLYDCSSVRPGQYAIDKDLHSHSQVKDEPWSEEWFRVFGPLNTSLGVPLIIEDKLAGMMRVRCQDGGSFTEQQVELAHALGHQVTLAMQLTQLAKEARQSAVVDERNRLAREIHDSLGQTFVSIMMRLQTVQLTLDKQSDKPLPEARANLEQALILARQGLVGARRSVQALRPLALEFGNLAQALQQYLAQITEGTAIQGTFAQTGISKPLPAAAELNLFRIGQEAIANAYNHADAGEIRVHLHQSATQVELSVQDDGRGFSLTDLSGAEGFGLASMQQRAQHIQATLSIDPQPQQGTRISVVLVLAAPSASDSSTPLMPSSLQGL